MRVPRIVFVMSRHQNAFFAELANAFVDALTATSVPALVVTDPASHEASDDDVFVLLPPHEYVTLEGSDFVDRDEVARRTIGLSAEQPHQVFFERNAAICARLGGVLDFSPLAVDAYRRLGIEARHQRFGYVPAWDRFDGGPRAPDSLDVEVLYLGNKRPRRLEVLAGAADALVEHRAVLRISDNAETNRSNSPTFVAGDAKRALLSSTRLLLNVHQGDEAYFEWLRFADAAHCGVPVLTERSVASEPFVDGIHYLSFEPKGLGPALRSALGDQQRLDAVALAAYTTLRERPLTSMVDPLVDLASRLLDRPPVRALPGSDRVAPPGRARVDPAPLATWRPSRRATALRTLRGRRPPTVFEPPGTTHRAPLVLPPGGLLIGCISDGRDELGVPTLEGIWPWEPWRLLHGQHLGRVLVVDADLADDVRRWITEPWVADHPHLAVQLFAAAHGLDGLHVARPSATLTAVVADPEHRLPDHVAARCRQILQP